MLEFKNVSYIYGKDTPFEMAALQDINIKIKKGKVTGIIGHTGSGKSTLCQMTNALVKPSSGQVLLNGEDIWAKGYDTKSVRFKVGLVFQYPEYQLFEETVEKDIAFGPKNMKLSDAEIKERVQMAAHFTGITPDMLEKSPFELSGGQKRRVAIAGSLAMKPDMLVLDEPAAGLDPRGKTEILSGLCQYREQTGTSLVIISHSMEDIALYCDEIITLSGGKVLTSGTPKDVFSKGDLIEKHGLSLPEVTSILLKLKNLGYDIDTTHFTIDEAAQEIALALSKA